MALRERHMRNREPKINYILGHSAKINQAQKKMGQSSKNVVGIPGPLKNVHRNDLARRKETFGRDKSGFDGSDPMNNNPHTPKNTSMNQRKWRWFIKATQSIRTIHTR